MEQHPLRKSSADESSLEDLQAQRLEQLYETIKQSKDLDLATPKDADFQEALTILRALDQISDLGLGLSSMPDFESGAERETQFDLKTIDSALRFDSADQLPAQLGRFQIQRLLGRGGHGMVLLARDEKLRRDVALKLPRPDVVLDPFLKQRFVQEAQFAAAVSHPNLVPVYEAGVIGPFCYIAYAFCEGTSLSRWLKQRREPVEPSLAARIISVLAEGIQTAHSQGIVHRDLKPSNVMLDGVDEFAETFDPAGSCKITDFGLAKSGSEDSDLTRSGAIVGTLAYLRPSKRRVD